MIGTLVRSSEKKTRVQFKLSKQRKIQRLRELLKDIEIPYTFKEATISGLNILQPYYIRIYGKGSLSIHEYLNNVKQFPFSWVDNLTKEQLLIVLNEIRVTDGSSTVYDRLDWCTTSEHDKDVILKSCDKYNIKYTSKALEGRSGFINGKLQYYNTIYQNSCEAC